MLNPLNFIRKLTGPPKTRVKPGMRIARFWKSKETGMRVEVDSWKLDLNGNEYLITIRDCTGSSINNPLRTYPWKMFLESFEQDGNLGFGNWGMEKK